MGANRLYSAQDGAPEAPPRQEGRKPRMLIRTKLIASHGASVAAVTLVALGIIAILRVGEANQRELRSSYEQIRAINYIAAWANDYSEQVAELFILGTGTAEVEESRQGLLAALDRKEALVREEMARQAEPERLEEAQELARIDAIRSTLRQLEGVRVQIVSLLEAGRRAEAEAVYREQIEHRLDSVLGALIEAATERERGEVIETIASSEALADRLRLLAIGLVAGAALLALVSALTMHRAISRPIRALVSGAEAVGRGDLAHVVDVPRPDEFGRLAARFNAMTAQLREARDRLLRANEELEQQVAARTSELRARGDQLEDAVARLKEVDESRARFFADISHELRTPLTILRGHAEVALRAPSPAPDMLRGALSRVVGKADQMGRLVEDLLFLARSEAGTIVVERKPIDLQEVFADVLLDSQGLSRRAGVTISPRQSPDPVLVSGDAGRLRQAILIPVDNAIRLAPADTSVRLELASRDGRAIVTIADEGPGFTPEEAERAFVRFFRGDGGRGRAGRGLGLGLSIARWIIDQHGGTISIDSQPGKGAAVRIDLPLMGAA